MPTSRENTENLKIQSLTSTTAKSEATPPRMDCRIRLTFLGTSLILDRANDANNQKQRASSGVGEVTGEPRLDRTFLENSRP